MSKKWTDKTAKEISRQVQKHEASHQNSFGFVDRDWDRLEDTENEFAERLRTRGTF